MDLYRWIYTKDAAAWLEGQNSLTLNTRIECICAAPHRTLAEKLEGLKELQLEYNEKLLQDKIENMKTILHDSCTDSIRYPYLYGIEIFYKGEKDCFLPVMLFRTAKEAGNVICQCIEKAVQEDCLEKRDWYGMITVFRRGTCPPHGFIPLRKIITRYDGDVIYVQDDKSVVSSDMGYFDVIKIPYPSGTIVSILENPFFPSMKGILVNVIEPDEENFADDPCCQWMIYPTSAHMDQTHGIGIVNLRDDYIPFKSSPDFIFPYKQFVEVYKGKLSEHEIWLSELSHLIKANKGCIGEILLDREPKNSRRISADAERLNYVRKLAVN